MFFSSFALAIADVGFMPVVLTRPDEWAQWLTAPTPRALELQRPLPDGELDIVLEAAHEDPA